MGAIVNVLNNVGNGLGNGAGCSGYVSSECLFLQVDFSVTNRAIV